MLFLVSFGIKAAAFPLFFWLPASYHTPPVAVSALFAGLLTKVGVYALYRFFTLLFTTTWVIPTSILLWMAGLTMVTGVLGAAAQYEIRRILSFHIVSQIGYMIMGLALFTPLALVGGCVLHHASHHREGQPVPDQRRGLSFLRGSYELKQLGGLWRSRPGWVCCSWCRRCRWRACRRCPVSSASSSWCAPASRPESWGHRGVALVVGLLTLYSMIKIWE
jgi:multicomponent Na+:H+ antiporter subunit D